MLISTSICYVIKTLVTLSSKCANKTVVLTLLLTLVLTLLLTCPHTVNSSPATSFLRENPDLLTPVSLIIISKENFHLITDRWGKDQLPSSPYFTTSVERRRLTLITTGTGGNIKYQVLHTVLQYLTGMKLKGEPFL